MYFYCQTYYLAGNEIKIIAAIVSHRFITINEETTFVKKNPLRFLSDLCGSAVNFYSAWIRELIAEPQRSLRKRREKFESLIWKKGGIPYNRSF